ncbi:MAG: hypothetical protein ACREP8_10970 [Candidatus Binatia bacterium]
MATLSVVIFATPEIQHHLDPCLASVRWADAITVYRLDERGEVVATEEVKRLTDPDGGWVLHLWAEERVEAELREELQRLRGKNSSPAACYRIPIRSRLLDSWAEGTILGPSPALRLRREIKRLAGGWGEAVEEDSAGRAELLRGWIADYSLSDLSAGVDRVNRFSTLWAARAHAENRSFRPAAAVIRSLGIFVRLLWMNGIFSRGMAGVTVSALAAYAHLLSGAKLWEATHVSPRKGL